MSLKTDVLGRICLGIQLGFMLDKGSSGMPWQKDYVGLLTEYPMAVGRRRDVSNGSWFDSFHVCNMRFWRLVAGCGCPGSAENRHCAELAALGIVMFSFCREVDRSSDGP